MEWRGYERQRREVRGCAVVAAVLCRVMAVYFQDLKNNTGYRLREFLQGFVLAHAVLDVDTLPLFIEQKEYKISISMYHCLRSLLHPTLN